MNPIGLRGVREHNLTGFDLDLPTDSLIVCTGLSGSGKSSLAFDTIFRESQRLYLESLSSGARQFLGRLRRPAIDGIRGLPVAISVDQRTTVRHPRSTVATLSGLHDLLRLLFARVATAPCSQCGHRNDVPGSRCAKCETPAPKASRRLFSFNDPLGWCERCRGLGVEDHVDSNLLIADPSLTLREGALVPTTPNGYIVYSQVTVDVLDTVCRAHGFDVDTPWCDLEEAQRDVIFFGSDRLKVPFGKHPLESRLRWSGITAKPREEGYYRGLISIITETLKRNRNTNILRFVRSRSCSACQGRRLHPDALSFRVGPFGLGDLSALSVDALDEALSSLEIQGAQRVVADDIVPALRQRLEAMSRLGLSYLTLDRASKDLSGGEAQRLRLATQLFTGLSSLLYVLDEPCLGLHERDRQRLLETLWGLRDRGGSLLVVEHARRMIAAADWVVDLGPGAGVHGGRLVHSGPPEGLDAQSATGRVLRSQLEIQDEGPSGDPLIVRGARHHNLRGIDVEFGIGAFNVVTGVGGAGKSSLVIDTLAKALSPSSEHEAGDHDSIVGHEKIDRVIAIDQLPIGRTPRSNPATYTGLFDHVRALFASLPEALSRGWKKSYFSTNVRGGRCEDCAGQGVESIGMVGLPDVEVPCASCQGHAFAAATREIVYRDHGISDVLKLSIEEAGSLFEDQPKIRVVLDTLISLGLGYLRLGQKATTLSGGEAQRVKLASELSHTSAKRTLYVLDEPTQGLHGEDVHVLLQALRGLTDLGHTVVVIEHHLQVIVQADWVVDLGPGAGDRGGALVVQGTPSEVRACADSATGQVMREIEQTRVPREKRSSEMRPIRMRGVTTHNLKGVDVDIPRGLLTVITGPSGSGKSSLVFSTLAAEGVRRYSQTLSSQVRQRMTHYRPGEFRALDGVSPVIALDQQPEASNRRSTIGTYTGLGEPIRLLFSRLGVGACAQCDPNPRPQTCQGCREAQAKRPTARAFSFNHQEGACPSCHGLGGAWRCDPELLVKNSDRSLLDGALDGTKAGRFYGDPKGQHTAILRAVGRERSIDFEVPWKDLDPHSRRIAMFGTGEDEYDVVWEFERGRRKGTHEYRTKWLGFAGYVDEEYERKRDDARGESLRSLLVLRSCPKCEGERLMPFLRLVRLFGRRLPEVWRLSLRECQQFFEEIGGRANEREKAILHDPRAMILERLDHLMALGLDYLTLDRSMESLAGGELQRVRLAGQLGRGLRGLTYVLDEPTIGLHSQDTEKLIEKLHELRDHGHTVVVVEHDLDVMGEADHLIELGPGGGGAGGTIVASGSPADLASHPSSRTAKWLRGKAHEPGGRAAKAPNDWLRLCGFSDHNLANLDLAIPKGRLVMLSGVSGSGKSTLMHGIARRRLTGELDSFDRVSILDQSPLPQGERSLTVTVLGLYDEIRALFASSHDAKERGLRKSHFSTQSKGGRCESCAGLGRKRVELDFLADVWHPCEDCRGSRFTDEVLVCRYRDVTIAELLQMDCEGAHALFEDRPSLRRKLRGMIDIGLSYVLLGQPTSALSGGECQRLKVAAALAQDPAKEGLYLLDEPTSGLHPDDIEKLMGVLFAMVDRGHTLILIEHEMQCLAQADWVFDLGPGGGERGGRLLFEGTPERLSDQDSPTGRALKAWMER